MGQDTTCRKMLQHWQFIHDVQTKQKTSRFKLLAYVKRDVHDMNQLHCRK